MPQLGNFVTESTIAESERHVIYRGMHIGLGEPVAIKCVRGERTNRHAIERLMRLTKIQARLRDPHCVPAMDIGTNHADGTTYAVMELVPAPSVAASIRRGAFQPAAALAIIKDLCAALEVVHAAGFVHGRIAASHVLHGPVLRVIGVGYAKGDRAELDTDIVKYMPPEAVRRAPVDVRCDVWSVGVLLYELVEGYKPFDAESYSELCVKLAADPPATSMRMSPSLSLIVARCLEKAPERRFQSIAELVSSLNYC